MKRFTDTDLWKKQWYMELTPAEKIAWQYIVAECDNVGVWSPNFRLAEFIIGTQLDWEKFRNKCNKNIIVMKNGKWWLVDFIRFQYGELNESSPPHRSYIKLLISHGLYDMYLKGYTYPMDTLQEKEKDQDQEKDQEKDQEEESVEIGKVKRHRYGEYKHVLLTDGEYSKLKQEIVNADEWIRKIDEGIQLKGYKYKDHYLAILKWYRKDNPKPKQEQRLTSAQYEEGW